MKQSEKYLSQLQQDYDKIKIKLDGHLNRKGYAIRNSKIIKKFLLNLFYNSDIKYLNHLKKKYSVLEFIFYKPEVFTKKPVIKQLKRQQPDLYSVFAKNIEEYNDLNALQNVKSLAKAVELFNKKFLLLVGQTQPQKIKTLRPFTEKIISFLDSDEMVREFEVLFSSYDSLKVIFHSTNVLSSMNGTQKTRADDPDLYPKICKIIINDLVFSHSIAPSNGQSLKDVLVKNNKKNSWLEFCNIKEGRTIIR